MDALDTLRRKLGDAGASLTPGWAEGGMHAIEEANRTLEAWVKSGGLSKPTEDAVVRAMRAFARNGHFERPRDARYVSFGCAQHLRVGVESYCLLEDSRRFPKLLDQLTSTYGEQPLAFRRCYQGLLHSYFHYDPYQDNCPATGRENWSQLQAYLRDNAGGLRSTNRYDPDWVNAILAHREFFQEDACREFGRKALVGDTAEFDRLREQLSVHEASWVTRLFVLAQVEAAAATSDQDFKDLIPRLLQLLDQHEPYLSAGLSALLERYAACRVPDVHVVLRDFAVSQWGNPWLVTNQRKWPVSDNARQMVAGWLKLHLMRQFFELLADDGNNDERRLQFWLRYIDHIRDMYFALGGAAQTNSTADFKHLRKQMHGRRLRLTNGGAPSNNAFIMLIGDHVVVEFGLKGNACFVVAQAGGLPFGLEGDVAGDASELKHASRRARLLHHGDWENEFERELAHLLKVRPDAQSAKRAEPRTQQRDAPARTYFNEADFKAFMQVHKLHYDDYRSIGGALWVRAEAHPVLAPRLTSWGFRYKPGKGWWRGDA